MWKKRFSPTRETLSNNKIRIFRIKIYECQKCFSIYPIESFEDKPQNVDCLACYLRGEIK